MHESAMRIRAMGARPGDYVPDSWEGMMNMLSDTMKRGTNDEKAAAIMAAGAWVWAFKEHGMRRRIAEAEELIAGETPAPAAK
jgi:hypothetical protein